MVHRPRAAWIVRSLCLCLLAAGGAVTLLAIRSGVQVSAQLTRDLGVAGWLLYGALFPGALAQACAAVAVARGRVGRWSDLRVAFVLTVVTAVLVMALAPDDSGLGAELGLGACASVVSWRMLRAGRRGASAN